MPGKLKIIILLVLGLVSFGASFFIFGYLRPEPVPVSQLEGEAEQADAQESEIADAAIFTQPVSISLKERELDDLIKQLNFKIDACNKKEQQFAEREKRIQLSAENLTKQAHEMEAIRTRLIAPDGPIALAEEARARLERTRVRIDRDEQINVQKLAEQYDKMDAASASETLITMCKARKNDVVKILYYMSPKKSAQVIAEISDKTLAAELSGLLIEVHQESQSEG